MSTELTLIDHFAIAALPVLIADCPNLTTQEFAVVADGAYMFAQAMITARLPYLPRTTPYTPKLGY